MKIERIELHHITQDLVHPFRTSFGTQVARPAILVAVHSEGLVGWGECTASNDPGYSYETMSTAWHILKDFLVPALIGQDLDDPKIRVSIGIVQFMPTWGREKLLKTARLAAREAALIAPPSLCIYDGKQNKFQALSEAHGN